MQHITDKGLALIKHYEGFSAAIYLCAAGYPTVGYGHVVKPDERAHFATGITDDEGEQLLRRDVQIAEAAVLRLIRVPLTDGQFDALVSFTFNLGAGALQRSTLRRHINNKNHFNVSQEFAKWVWSGNQKLLGLARRRHAESMLYMSRTQTNKK